MKLINNAIRRAFIGGHVCELREIDNRPFYIFKNFKFVIPLTANFNLVPTYIASIFV